MAVGDFDGDGKPDYAKIKYYDSSKIYLSRNNFVTGDISFDPEMSYVTGALPTDTISGDIDGDGRPNIIYCRARIVVFPF